MAKHAARVASEPMRRAALSKRYADQASHIKQQVDKAEKEKQIQRKAYMNAGKIAAEKKAAARAEVERWLTFTLTLSLTLTGGGALVRGAGSSNCSQNGD